jgi:hypothetical protein
MVSCFQARPTTRRQWNIPHHPARARNADPVEDALIVILLTLS